MWTYWYDRPTGKTKTAHTDPTPSLSLGVYLAPISLIISEQTLQSKQKERCYAINVSISNTVPICTYLLISILQRQISSSWVCGVDKGIS